MNLAITPSASSSNSRVGLNIAFVEFPSILTVKEQKKLDSLMNSNAAATAASVLALTTEIDQTNAKRQSRRISARLQPYLDGIQQFTTVVDGFLDLDRQSPRPYGALSKLPSCYHVTPVASLKS